LKNHEKLCRSICQDAYYENFVAYTGSVYLTVLITIDRFIAVKMPLRAKAILTPKRTVLNVLALGIFSLALNFPRWIESVRWKYAHEGRYWNFYHRQSLATISEYRRIYHLYGWSFVMYVIPMSLMMVLNVMIWWEVILSNRLM